MKASRAALMISFALLSAACGRKGPLIYPDMLVPAAPAAASGQQSGAAVQIQFVLPDRDRSGRPVSGVMGAKISRMASEADQMEVCRSCLSDYLPLRTLYLDHLPTDTQRFGSLLVMRDGEVNAGSSYSYRIVPFSADGTEGTLATISGVRVMPPFTGPSLKAESFPTEIRLQCIMQPPASGQLLGCNLYRSAGSAGRVFQPINRQPLPGGEYVDTALERGVTYRYAARSLLKVTTGAVVESLDSVEVEGMLKNDE